MAPVSSSGGLSDALVILGCAGVVIPAFARFRISPIIGFIVSGVLVGPHVLGGMADRWPWLEAFSISNPEGVTPFAEFGIVLLLFSVGLDLSFRRLWSMRRSVIGFGGSELLGSGVLIAAALMVVGENMGSAAGLGVALALSSTALVIPIAGTTGPVGRLAFAMLLFEDLALVPIVFVLSAVGGSAAGLEGVLRPLIGGVVVVGAMLLAGPFVLPRLFAQAARTRTPELFLSVSLLVAILASLAAAAVGLSPIVGALVAGLLIAETDYAHEVESVIAPFRGLALGIFLISVGMGLDLAAIAARWPVFVGAVAGVVLVKAVVTTALLRIGGVRPGVAAETGLLMASPSETTLIVLATAAAAGVIAPATASFWQVVTAIGLTITPLLARLGHDAARLVESRRRTQTTSEPTVAARTLIVGYGRVGRMVADLLDRHARAWIGIEANIDLVTLARREDKPVRYGDAARRGGLDGFGIETAAAVVLTMDSAVEAVRLTRDLRGRFPELTIVARARDADHAAELYRAGATDAVPETLESALQLAEALLVDLGVAMGPVIASVHELRDELRAAIKEGGGLREGPRLKGL